MSARGRLCRAAETDKRGPGARARLHGVPLARAGSARTWASAPGTNRAAGPPPTPGLRVRVALLCSVGPDAVGRRAGITGGRKNERAAPLCPPRLGLRGASPPAGSPPALSPGAASPGRRAGWPTSPRTASGWSTLRTQTPRERGPPSGPSRRRPGPGQQLPQPSGQLPSNGEDTDTSVSEFSPGGRGEK